MAIACTDLCSVSHTEVYNLTHQHTSSQKIKQCLVANRHSDCLRFYLSKSFYQAWCITLCLILWCTNVQQPIRIQQAVIHSDYLRLRIGIYKLALILLNKGVCLKMYQYPYLKVGKNIFFFVSSMAISSLVCNCKVRSIAAVLNLCKVEPLTTY